MIRPNQIPDEVVEAAKEAYRNTNEKTMSDWLAEIIAAALNAWPGSYSLAENDSAEIRGVAAIILPLPLEVSDDT